MYWQGGSWVTLLGKDLDYEEARVCSRLRRSPTLQNGDKKGSSSYMWNKLKGLTICGASAVTLLGGEGIQRRAIHQRFATETLLGFPHQ